MARLTLRIDLGDAGAVGPGKVRLLEEIARLGSISAAARALGMSYRRGWLLIDAMNRTFAQPVVTTKLGGGGGGGAELTRFGAELAARYRAMEREATRAVGPHLDALDGARGEPPAER